MKQLLLLIPIVLLLATAYTHAQGLNQQQMDYLAEHNIELIDSSKLYNTVLQNNGKVKMVVTFTNYCAGTPYVFKNIAAYKEQFGDKMEYILCSSAPKKQLDELVALLEKEGYKDKLYLIDPNVYKEYRADDRKKGHLFRNQVCAPCNEDVIGTPYRIFFDSNKNILFYGYSSRKNFDELLAAYFAGH